VETKTSELKILEDRLENDNKGLLAHNKSLETDFKSIQQKLTQADKEHETLLEKYKTSEQTTENYKVQLKRTENEILNLNNNIDKFKNDVEVKRTRIGELENEIKESVSEKEAVVTELNRLHTECADLKKIHERELTRVTNDLEERITSEVLERNNQFEKTMSIFQNIVGENNKIPKKKNETTEEFIINVLQPWIHSKIKELKRSIECSTKEKIIQENQKTRRDFGSQSEELDEKSESIASQEPLILDDPILTKEENEEIEELKTRIIQFEENNKINVERVTDLENYKQTTQSLILELENTTQDLDKKLSEKEEKINTLEKKLKQSETNCLSASRTKDESNIRIEKLKKHNLTIKANLESKDTEILSLKEKIRGLEELREKDHHRFKSELENLKKDLEKKNTEVTTANKNSKMVAIACFTIFLVVIVVGDFWFNGESPSSWLSFSKVTRFFNKFA